MPDDLRVLGFDTSAAHCAAAVICGDRLLAQRVEPMTKGQAERLFPLLEEVLAEAGLAWSDLDAIGVGIGPGNFTGIRISVAAARGLALSLGIPAAGVSATEAAACDVPRPCRAVVPLRGDEVVWQDFTTRDDPAWGRSEDGETFAHPARVSSGLTPRDQAAARKAGSPDTRPAAGLVAVKPGAEGACRATVLANEAAGENRTASSRAAGRSAPAEVHEQNTVEAKGSAATGPAGSDRLSPAAEASAADEDPATPLMHFRQADVFPDMAGPVLARAGDLPPGPSACVPVHPVAVAIAQVARGRVATMRSRGAALPRPAPLYLRPADAAPPRDPPPMILR